MRLRGSGDVIWAVAVEVSGSAAAALPSTKQPRTAAADDISRLLRACHHHATKQGRFGSQWADASMCIAAATRQTRLRLDLALPKHLLRLASPPCLQSVVPAATAVSTRQPTTTQGCAQA